MIIQWIEIWRCYLIKNRSLISLLVHFEKFRVAMHLQTYWPTCILPSVCFNFAITSVNVHRFQSFFTVTARNNYENKKAVLSQRWPRDARYISRSWAVVKIWPFEIIQDGGVEFVRIENSGCRDIATWNFSNMAVAAILDLFEPEIAPLDPPSPKTLS